MNEGLDSDFFKKQYPVVDWRALQAMSPEERRRYSGGDGKR
jgi:hypothetical protein